MAEKNEQTETKFEERQPVLSRSISLSRDGNWLILKTIRTDILHVNYIDKIIGGKQ